MSLRPAAGLPLPPGFNLRPSQGSNLRPPQGSGLPDRRLSQILRYSLQPVFHFESCRKALIRVPFDVLAQLDHTFNVDSLQARPLPGATLDALRQGPGLKIKRNIAKLIHPGSGKEWRDGMWDVLRDQRVVTFEIARGDNGFASREYLSVTLSELRTDPQDGGRKLVVCKTECVSSEGGSGATGPQDPSAPEDSAEDEESWVIVE